MNGEDDEWIVVAGIALIVVALLLIRSCIPAEYHHPAERPLAPPESLYAPGG